MDNDDERDSAEEAYNRELIRNPDPIPSPLPEPKKCGIGQGDQCCAYLFADGTGFNCGRVEDTLGGALMQMGKKRGLRLPTATYPDCQL